ncbi:alpha-amylase 3, chloroplastic [Senna tora]|uniref:alpha-amylase n=1 Tax=Senna tora TaxID=362788 RepID=A0A834TWW0_9FABA|nr:alpha-amylase 3, chloroplastic [Senna tora]
MSTVSSEAILHICRREIPSLGSKSKTVSFVNYSSKHVVSNINAIARSLRPLHTSSSLTVAAASTDTHTPTLEASQSADVSVNKTFPINRTEMVEGKISIRLDQGKDSSNWELRVGCNLPGKWILHWGVSRVNDVGSEWDQPPSHMIPPGSIPVKSYAVETPLKKPPSSLSAQGDAFYEVRIDLKPGSNISAINFVLKDERTGVWYQDKGRDFKVPLANYLKEDANIIGPKRGFNFWPGALGQLFNMLLKSKATGNKDQSSQLEGFCVELPITKEVSVNHSISVSIKKCSETGKNLLYLETDLPGDLVLHWGVCRNEARRWEVPPAPHPPETVIFKDKALRTPLQPRDSGTGKGCSISITLGEDFSGFLFVVKLNGTSWLKYMGNDFYVPIPISSSSNESQGVHIEEPSETGFFSGFTDGIINEITNLVSDKTKSKEESERLDAEVEKQSLPSKIYSGTGTGYEILCQGFNWESHKSGRWYMELKEKAAELASLGFSVIWLPPPTDSVSPEGYMPKDLYNLNSRYGNIDELKDLVKRFHQVGIKVLGDAVINHRCAQYQNQNGVWNIFGGRLNWDDRAVVADDPHFQVNLEYITDIFFIQGRGNKSSGDNFHAAPNIDHSQEFVRNDLKQWLCWMRKEIGYDGWRLDFVRGFWGGYVKDYVEASEPYLAVGEYWDSLSYTYGEMDHNQDAHRQRIIDWINATNGSAGAFDVTTKGILHSALERCEYWRLSDQKGKPPGVIGWWPSRAVTFIENHDTGSTQGHWRFPSGKEMQGYAYILTHPGTPSVFYDHIFSHYQTEIQALISLRKRNKIHCRSTVQIVKVERDVYAAIIDEKIAMKIGPGHFEPPSGSQRWSLAGYTLLLRPCHHHLVVAALQKAYKSRYALACRYQYMLPDDLTKNKQHLSSQKMSLLLEIRGLAKLIQALPRFPKRPKHMYKLQKQGKDLEQQDQTSITAFAVDLAFPYHLKLTSLSQQTGYLQCLSDPASQDSMT